MSNTSDPIVHSRYSISFDGSVSYCKLSWMQMYVFGVNGPSLVRALWLRNENNSRWWGDILSKLARGEI